MPRRVVITGIGPVTSAGIGREAFFDSVWNHPPSPRPAAFDCGYAFQSRWFMPLPDLPESPGLAHDNLMQPEDRMAVLAARLALEDAGFAASVDEGRIVVNELDPQTGVLLGIGLGGLQTAFESHLCHVLPKAVLQSALPGRRLAFSRMVIPKTMPNSPAAWVSIMFQLTGQSQTVNAACASGAFALGEAFRKIRDGYANTLLAGGVESLQESSGGVMRGFDSLGVLTRSADGLPGPFGISRSGFLFAEGGACVLVLEELRQALVRGARIYAEIAGCAFNTDPYGIVQMNPEGGPVARLMEELSRGRQIDYINAHGTGTQQNDEIEAQAIRRVFGGKQPLVNSTKGILGHTLGASGAIEAAVTALSIARGTIHGNRTTDPMPALNLPLKPVQTPIRHALSFSFGFGGHNAGLLFSKYEP